MTSIPVVTDKRFDTALLVLRLVVGTIFIMHGYQKVFTIGIASITTMFTHMGVPFAALVAPLVAVLELVGGIAIVLGVVTRIAGLLLAIDMFCAILIVHAKNGFFLPKGMEFVFGNMGMALALALAGAGAYSISALMARRGRPAP
ncbi:MAG TPA: DoxX family protein [Gemmatimonadaceae bacterium]|nr:DoxX family protein [Gemmatimonadaceae bacterium]